MSTTCSAGAASPRSTAGCTNCRPSSSPPTRPGSTRCAPIPSLNGAPCGALTLTSISSTQRRAQWGWYIGEAEARGRGAGRAAQALGLDLAFTQFDLHKVWSEVPAGHETALKAQAAAGFRREGYLRRHAFKRGEFRDVVLMAILAEEWTVRRESVRRDLIASGMIAA